MAETDEQLDEQRLDLCLYSLRFYKTRGLAQAMVEKGRVRVNGDKIKKSSRKIRPQDVLVFPQGNEIRTIRILGLPQKRGAAPVAQAHYEDLSDFELEQSGTSS